MVQVRFNGISQQFLKDQLSLHEGASDSLVLRRVARVLGVVPADLGNYIVDRKPSGTWIVHPKAVHG